MASRRRPSSVDPDDSVSQEQLYRELNDFRREQQEAMREAKEQARVAFLMMREENKKDLADMKEELLAAINGVASEFRAYREKHESDHHALDSQGTKALATHLIDERTRTARAAGADEAIKTLVTLGLKYWQLIAAVIVALIAILSGIDIGALSK